MTFADVDDPKSNARRSDGSAAGGGSGSAKRRKVNHACLYCRRSHMHCDENRPCARCIKRDIGHLCHDEIKPPAPRTQPSITSIENSSNSRPSMQTSPIASSSFSPTQAYPGSASYSSLPGVLPAMKVDSVGLYGSGAGSTSFVASTSNANLNSSMGMTASNWPLVSDHSTIFGSDSVGTGEFSVLSHFLNNMDTNQWLDASIMSSPTASLLPTTMTPMMTQQPQPTGSSDKSVASAFPLPSSKMNSNDSTSSQRFAPQPADLLSDVRPKLSGNLSSGNHSSTHEFEHVDPLPPTNKAERFLLTAADQEEGTRDERLKSVIRAKYEAGLLKPYNYVKGYARLSHWMEKNVSAESRQAILQPISILRPKFRAIAQTLKDIDLVYTEESFERLLLDYDRVFSAMGIPACLWRRTGEIYKANKSFADLVGVDVTKMRDGRLCIYEIMSENSAVNYWEKYGHVAFDDKQKAVLTSCVLRYKPSLPALQGNSVSGGATPKAFTRKRLAFTGDFEEAGINCCFSFTVRRDIWGIPSMIVGNFIKC